MNDVIRIGTRDSKLALWQANHAKYKFEKLNIPAEIIKIKSEGDLNQITPLYEFGVTGIFTKNLDQALLNNEIDDYYESKKQSNGDAVMIGRGSYGRPWIFEEIKHHKRNIKKQFDILQNDKKIIILEHFSLALEHYGIDIGLKSFRKHLGWYSKSLKSSSEFRLKINNCTDHIQVERYIKDFF